MVAGPPCQGFSIANLSRSVDDSRNKLYKRLVKTLVKTVPYRALTDKEMALAEMKRVVRPGGMVGFYVWDYPGGGMEFMRVFWNEATALNPGALSLTEDSRLFARRIA